MKVHKDGSKPTNGEIFVFGSNLAGVHGAGAAREAYQSYGAKWGKGVGLTGQSYAIPTKDEHINSMSLSAIQQYVDDFIESASLNQHHEFFMTRVGCGLAGNSDADMVNLFMDAFVLPNISFPKEWADIYEAIK